VEDAFSISTGQAVFLKTVQPRNGKSQKRDVWADRGVFYLLKKRGRNKEGAFQVRFFSFLRSGEGEEAGVTKTPALRWSGLSRTESQLLSKGMSGKAPTEVNIKKDSRELGGSDESQETELS